MKQFLSFIRRSALGFCLFASIPALTVAQQGPGGLGGIIGVQSINTTSITVEVRGEDGAKLNSMAIVNLSNIVGQMVKSQTTFGSQSVFQVGAGAYVVEVEAFGYEKARVQAEVSSARPDTHVTVKLKPDTSNGFSFVGSGLPPISPKAQKELARAIESYQTNKFDDAIHRLQAARGLAPTHPDIPYLQGVIEEKRNDYAGAREYWDQAIRDNPRHIPSLMACAESYLRENDPEHARKYLDVAVEAEPNSWRAHDLLASVLLRQKSYPEAVTHAQRAIELGKEKANSSRLILGQALAAEGQLEPAIQSLKGYLAGNPPAQQAQAVEKLLARLNEAVSASATGGIEGVVTTLVDSPASSDIPDPPLTAEVLHWLPANVDDAVPPVEPGVSCSLDDVLKNVSTRVQELPAVVDRYTATEVLHQEDVNNAGIADKVSDLSFNYVASVREIKSKYGDSLDVQEYRNGSTGTEMFPNQMASVGLPSIVLIFHPLLAKDFDMKCEGLSRATGGFAWQVYFRQRADLESRIRRYRMGGHVFPIALKGRAWIDANTFQVVRLETDLRESHPDLRLKSEHLVMQYGPVKFKTRNEELWLPGTADYYAVLRGQRFHRRHKFTNYILFSVEHNEKIGTPPQDKTGAGPTTEKN